MVIENLRLFAVVPAFNEELNIAKTVSLAKKYVDSVIVVDDGSLDNTSLVAEAAGADFIIKNEINRGQGASICIGIRKAFVEGADITITIDGDFQHDPNDIPQIIKPIVKKEYDVVIGSRFFNGIGHVPKMRLIFNMILSLCNRVLFGFKAIDSQSGFRAFNRRAMKTMKLKTKRYDWTSEMADIIVQKKLKYKEVGITIRYFEKKNQANFQDALSMLNGMIKYYFYKHFK